MYVSNHEMKLALINYYIFIDVFAYLFIYYFVFI